MKPRRTHAVLFFERRAPLLAQCDRLAHIDFVEGGQYRRGVLRRFQPLGDAPPQPRHPHPHLALADGHRRWRRRFRRR
jgi:hypothetical protein